MMDKKLLEVGEAAAVLNLGRSKTYSLVMSGELRSIKIGRCRRIPIEAIDEFIANVREGEIWDKDRQEQLEIR